jgi:CheY-like chemotaxis protein
MKEILIVEDDPSMINLYRAYFKGNLGQHVTYMHNGMQAIRLVTSRKFDFALVDTDCPQKFLGIAVVAAIRESSLRTKIMAVSGRVHAMPLLATMLKEAGANVAIDKSDHFYETLGEQLAELELVAA